MWLFLQTCHGRLMLQVLTSTQAALLYTMSGESPLEPLLICNSIALAAGDSTAPPPPPPAPSLDAAAAAVNSDTASSDLANGHAEQQAALLQ